MPNLTIYIYIYIYFFRGERFCVSTACFDKKFYEHDKIWGITQKTLELGCGAVLPDAG